MTPDDPSEPLTGDDRLWILLDRYVSGEATDEERESVRVWLAADPTRLATLQDLQRIRAVAQDHPPHRTVDGAWKRLLLQTGRLPHDGEDGSGVPRDFVPRHRSLSWVGIAVAATVVLAVGVGYRRLVDRPVPAKVSAAPRVLAATRGQRAVFRLMDGTQVTLAPESRLTVPAAFGTTDREITLEGEAMFDAVHDDLRPFLVRVRGAVVHDLGTRFAVRGYGSDSTVRVVVTEGRVQLRSGLAPRGSGALLDRGMLAEIDGAGATAVRTNVDTTRYVSWTAGRLVFEGTPMREVARELERWYDIEIRLPDAGLAARRLTARIDDQPLSHLLDQLAVSLGVRANRVGRTVTLTPLQSGSMPRTDTVSSSMREGGSP